MDVSFSFGNFEASVLLFIVRFFFGFKRLDAIHE